MAGGRPQADTETKRDSRFAVRLTAAERAKLDAHAAAAGVHVSDYARNILVDAPPPRRRSKPTAQGVMTAAELREFNAVGVNLNQLMKRINAGDMRDVSAPVADVIGQLQTIFARCLK